MKEHGPRRGARMAGALLLGLLAGALLVAALALPLYASARISQAKAAIRQENLLAACGEAYDAFEYAEVSLTILLDGVPHAGMAASADSLFWYTPQGGELTLNLAPRAYDFAASWENRTVTLRDEAAPGEDNRVVLDVANAPDAPALLLLEAERGEEALFPLEIRGAEEVILETERNGVSIQRGGGSFALAVDTVGWEPGFYHFILHAQNEAGQAITHVGLRIARDAAVTPVYTVEDLGNIRRNLSGSYRLMNDLDMSDVDNWVPIGNYEYPFRGVFDGGGHAITGFHAPKDNAVSVHFSLFGITTNAEIRNLIARAPDIAPDVPERDLNESIPCAVFVTELLESLMENCASIGGNVLSPSGNAGGVLNNATESIMLGLFNSTDLFCVVPNRYLPHAGGVTGSVVSSYIAYCANEGDVKGNHLTGGVTGYGYNAQMRHCISSGFTWGSTIVGAVPAGALAQTFDGGSIAYGYFVRGQSAQGGRVFQPGVVNSLRAIEEEDLKNPEALAYLGAFGGDAPRWAYVDAEADGPVPIEVARFLSEGREQR